MNALQGRIPRAIRNHRTPEGAAYGRYCRAVIARLGPLPDDARPTLREAGRLTLYLDHLAAELEARRAAKRPRSKDLRRLERDQRKARVQLLMFERRLEEIAGHRKAPDLARAIQEATAADVRSDRR